LGHEGEVRSRLRVGGKRVKGRGRYLKEDDVAKVRVRVERVLPKDGEEGELAIVRAEIAHNDVVFELNFFKSL